jgi:hypothetical protein
MTRKNTLLTFALAALVSLPTVAFGRGNCTDVPLQLVVAPQTSGQGGISGDGLSIYNNPNDPAFNGGTQYVDGVGGVYVKFQVCNGTNDFILNLRSTKSPIRYIDLDFSFQLAPADTASGAVSLTGQQIQQQGQQINEMANAALYSNRQFVTCSGMMLNALSQTVTGGNAWFEPTTIYAPVVPDCNGGTGPDLANQAPQGTNTSPGAGATGQRLHLDCVADVGQHRLVVSHRRRRDCENRGAHEHLGGGRSVPDAVQLRNPKAQLHTLGSS